MKKFILSGLLLTGCMAFSTLPNPDDVPINQIQVIGSHNSYKQSIDPKLFKFLAARDSAGMSKIDYGHIPLADQLNLGLLNLEIDIYADEKGGKFAHPQGLTWVKEQAPYDINNEMMAPGFKVFHVPDIDFRSNCLTLNGCLIQLKTWSDEHPQHLPVFITIEPKEGQVKGRKFTEPEPFTEKTFDELDEAFLTHLGRRYIITPDDVRGKYSTLNEAVIHQNWPKLKDAKGKFLFILDAHDHKRDLYINGHPSLKGRVLFADAVAGTPEAAAMIMNNSVEDNITDMVKKGYIVRTFGDGSTEDVRRNDKTNFEAAKASGAQIISTDYYQKSTHFKSDYVLSFDNGNKYFRPNPISQSSVHSNLGK